MEEVSENDLEVDDDLDEAKPLLLATRVDKGLSSGRPPPPSSRTASAPPATSAKAPSLAPAPPGTAKALNVTPAPSLAASATNGAPAAAVRATRPPPKPSSASTPSVAPAAAKSTPSVAPAAAKSAPTPVVPSAPTSVAGKSREPWRMRDAARVSIVKSSTEPGLYYVRVLEDGKRPFEGFEGLLVALDPESTLRP